MHRVAKYIKKFWWKSSAYKRSYCCHKNSEQSNINWTTFMVNLVVEFETYALSFCMDKITFVLDKMKFVPDKRFCPKLKCHDQSICITKQFCSQLKISFLLGKSHFQGLFKSKSGLFSYGQKFLSWTI